MADGADERLARLEHRMDLMLERLAHHDKRIDDLIVNINARFDDVNARFDDVGRTIDSRFEDFGRIVDSRFEGKASSWAVGMWVSVAMVWVTLVVGVATAISSNR